MPSLLGPANIACLAIALHGYRHLLLIVTSVCWHLYWRHRPSLPQAASSLQLIPRRAALHHCGMGAQ